jgi:hypothetical protein
MISLLFLISATNCERRDSVLSPEKHIKEIIYSDSLTGQVFLENQAEHSNCLIFLDSLKKGLSSDSIGKFTIHFDETDSVYSGHYKIRYFLYDYMLDTRVVAIYQGKVILDSLDVKGDGSLTDVTLKQLIEISCTVDTSFCKPGDSVFVTGRVKNISNRSILLKIPEGDVNNGLGYLGFFHSPNHYSFGVPRFSGVIHPLEWEWLIGPQEKYETSEKIKIPIGAWRNGIFYPMEEGEYVVVPSFQFPSQDSSLTKEIREFIHHKWYEVHKGDPPCWSFRPNKYKYDKIMVYLN